MLDNPQSVTLHPIAHTMGMLVAVCTIGSTSNTVIALDEPELRVLQRGIGPDDPSRMLYEFLTNEAGKHFDRRRAAIANLKSEEDVKRRQRALRAEFIRSLGGFPEKTPLNATVVGHLQGEGFRVEKVIFESRPHHHVTAALYLPLTVPPYPGVLVPCGHSANGKAAEAYQRISILLAKNGMAALCYDPIGQGERSQSVDLDGKPTISGSTAEHTLAGIGSLLVGRQTASYRIWDGIRALDYLASRPEVDAARLGCTGNSGGGTLTAYLMALDDRIVAAAPSCYITSLERLFATIGPQDAEQNITGQVAFGMEHADYITMRAPRPTLLCIGKQDYFDYEGARTTFQEAKSIYKLLGHGEHVDWFEYDDKHGFSRPRREAAMRWMRRWLLGKEDSPNEPEFPIFTDQELQCTSTGQVLRELKGKSVFDLNTERKQELVRERSRRPLIQHEPALRHAVRRLLALPDLIPAAISHDVGRVERESYSIQKLLFETEKAIFVPALLFTPNKASHDKVILYLSGAGIASAAADPKAEIYDLLRNGKRVLAMDPRGIGETAPKPANAGRPGYFGVDQKEFFLALHLGRPLFGQRVYDTMAVVNAMKEKGTEEVSIIGVGDAGPVALHAAALDERLLEVRIQDSVISWEIIVDADPTRNHLSNVVPDVLSLYDYPDLAALIAPRRLEIYYPVNSERLPVPQGDLESTYRFAIDIYAKSGMRERLELRADIY